jgi:dTDP-4-dehydrorhamnose reductase
MLGWLESSLKERREVVLFSDEYRTPIHLDDAAYALLRICELNLVGLWHCGGPERISRADFGKLVAQVGQFPSDTISVTLRAEVPMLPERPEDVSLDSNRLFSCLGFKPRSVHAALHQIYDTADVCD